MSKNRFFTRYDEIRYIQSHLPFSPSKTQQCFADECDINEIVKRPNLGINPFSQPTTTFSFGDFIDVKDFQMSQNIMAKAVSDFERLPSKIRDRFQNDIHKFYEFVSDSKNVEEGIKLGIYEKISTPVEKMATEVDTQPDLPVSSVDVAEPSAQ